MRRALLALLAACGPGSRTPDAAVPPTLTAADFARACVIAESCSESGGIDPGSCVADLEYLYSAVSALRPQEVRCLADAVGCEAADACLGISVSQTPCPSAGGAQTCVGDILQTCFESTTIRTDCSVYLTPDSRCLGNTPTCAVRGCNPGDPETQCDGTVVLGCQPNGVYQPFFDCAAVGGNCEPTARGPFQCVNKGGAQCPGWSCDSSTLITCDHDGRELRTNCKKLYGPEATCMTYTPLSSGPACVYGTDCPVGVISGSCSGSSYELCILGKKLEVNCTDLGLGPCAGDYCRKRP